MERAGRVESLPAGTLAKPGHHLTLTVIPRGPEGADWRQGEIGGRGELIGRTGKGSEVREKDRGSWRGRRRGQQEPEGAGGSKRRSGGDGGIGEV